ncbi:MAG: BLUF domain-containing protein [Vicinamibacteria bacterium]
MLVRLLYASRSTAEIDDALLGAISVRSSVHNNELGITGLLCTYPQGKVFLQALEGGREAVNTLYAKILQDPRHHDVTLLSYEEITERSFSSWRMGMVNLNRVNIGSILRFSEKPVLDPFSMNGQSALLLLRELATSAAIASRDTA